MSFCPSRCDSRARHFIHFETNIVANENCENCPVSNINIGKVNFTFGAHGSFIRFSNWNSQLTQNLVFIYYHHRCRRQRCRCDSETAKRTELIAVTMSSYFPRIALDSRTQNKNALSDSLFRLELSRSPVDTDSHCFHANFRWNSNWNARDNTMKVEQNQTKMKNTERESERKKTNANKKMERKI